MEGEVFDARAIAQAVLAKVKAAHEVEADPRSKPADQDSVKFRESDGSIRTVRATSLTPDDWAKLENAAILPSNVVVSDRSVDVKGVHGKVRFRDLAVLVAEACCVYDHYGQSSARFEQAAAVQVVHL